MKTVERKKLEKEMYAVANKVVGNTSTDKFESDDNNTIKELVVFCLHREVLERSEIMDTWAKWIKAYCDFVKLHRSGLDELIDDPELVVHWKVKPIVMLNGWDDDPIDSSPDYVRVRAELVITRIDRRPVTFYKNVFPRVVVDEG